MRTGYSVLFSLLFSAILAQAPQSALPNAGFESWTNYIFYKTPNSWDNLNDETAIGGQYTVTRASGSSAIHSGTYAIFLESKYMSMVGTVVPGVVTTGSLVTTAPYGIVGGIPYTLRPDSLTG